MKVAYIAMGDPHDRNVWSGTPYYALAQMRRRVASLTVLETPRLDRWIKRVNGAVRRLGWDLTRNSIVLALYARALRPQLEAFGPDVILAVGGEYKLAWVGGDYPAVFVSDGLFCSIVDYYAKFRCFRPSTRRRAIAIEADFVRPANRRLALMSRWAAQSAIDTYGIPGERVPVIPIGANLESDPGRAVLEQVKEDLNLLWIGVDWERKGGTLLLESFALLRATHPKAQLHIVGIEPDVAKGKTGVYVHGFLRKSVPSENETLMRLFAKASLYVMLSAEEAFGLVYCEAAAFGVPSIGYRTGGVMTIVEDGTTGILLETSATAQNVASTIVGLWQDQPRYTAMRQAARERYETVLNWDAWGDAVVQELTKAAQDPAR